MPAERDDLQLLELEPPITEAALSRAYRRLVIEHHPDLGGDGEAMARINRARDRLLASLEAPPCPPPKPIHRGATVVIDDETDDPSPLIYFVWMVLIPALVLTFLFAMLWMAT